MFQRHICEVEVDAFHEHVGGYQDVGVFVFHHRAIVANTLECGGVDMFNAFGDSVDKTEFTEACYFGLFFLHDVSLRKKRLVRFRDVPQVSSQSLL